MHKGDMVFHSDLGAGRIRLIEGKTALVAFDHGIEECLISELELRQSAAERLTSRSFDPMLPVLCRVMAGAIRSVNDEWGVFATSRINLLPHQLWVCRRVLETEPARWLVADDVGLGKTIEAGLVLLSMRSAGRLRRCLIIVPASLTGQWQRRMLGMFDLRFELYKASEDTAKNEKFWQGDRLVIASMQTLSMNRGGRVDRLALAEEWDMVVVDEAHRLNIEERSKGTLSYRLLYRLQDEGRIKSLLFFTGTPHKGKNYSFFSMLNLLQPGLIEDVKNAGLADYEKIPQIMIRNNKQKVTDMSGNKLFQPVTINKESYAYSEAEARFYDTLTEFVERGRIYAQDQSAAIQKIVYFLLTTIQKLASSSIAAVKKALKSRVRMLEDKLAEARAVLDGSEEDVLEDGSAEAEADQYARLKGVLPDEIAALRELLDLAEAIETETKMEEILTTVRETYSQGEAILFFTEYKATQALLISLLRSEYGHDAVVFINGDEALAFGEDEPREAMSREMAAERFNSGTARFLVSTEAAGEGIDLQENSHVLFHVDLPWNPMRLHQRLGRLHRYGQKYPVQVHMFRNPDTVESLIWEKLEEKLQNITAAFQGMEDPEDMCLAVIGTAANSFFTDLFSHAPRKGGNLSSWFDVRAATFGGKDVVSEVRRMFKHVNRFDFGPAAANLPQTDLKDLMPYTKLALSRAGAKLLKTDDARKLAFKTPKEYAKGVQIAPQYSLVFSRETHCCEGEDLAGLGLAIIDKLVDDGCSLLESYAPVPGLTAPLFIFRIRDKVTTNKQLRQRIVAVTREEGSWQLLRDWELLLKLNDLAGKLPRKKDVEPQGRHPEEEDMAAARQWLEANLAPLNLPYKIAETELTACLCPSL